MQLQPSKTPANIGLDGNSRNGSKDRPPRPGSCTKGFVSCTTIPEPRQQLLLQRACEIYSQNFSTSESGSALLLRHGVKDMHMVTRYGLGFSDGSLGRKLPRNSPDRSDLITLGLLRPDGVESFSGEIIFPVFGSDGRHSNVWVDAPKNSPNCLAGRPLGLWNLRAARHAEELYVNSNPFDALSLIEAGFSNTVALHPELGEIDNAALRAFGVQRMHIITGDTPEELAAQEQLAARLHGWNHCQIVLPKCGGVREFLQREGMQTLAETLRAARHAQRIRQVPGLRPLPGGFSLTLENRGYEVRGLQADGRRLGATVRVERGDRWHIDTFDFHLARARKEFLREVARIFEEPVDVIAGDLGKLLAACECRAAQPDFIPPSTDPLQIAESDQAEAMAMARDPNLIDVILRDFSNLGVVGETTNKLLCYLAMTSRKQRHPVSVMFVSSSGAGKNTVADAARDLCPPDERVEATNLSGKALFHFGADALKNKLLAIDEREGAKQADYSLRVLLSASRLITRVAIKDPTSGKLRTDSNCVVGPVSVLITTTDPNTDPETKSRFIVTSSDESAEQTCAIRAHQWGQHTLAGLCAEQRRQSICRRHHAFQRILTSIPVIFPTPECIGHADPRLSGRRDLPKILRLVQAVALVRQFQKPVKQHDGLSYLEVDETDLRIAAPLIEKTLGAPLDDLSPPSRNLLNCLIGWKRTGLFGANAAGEIVFSRREVREFSGLPNSTLHRYLNELVDFEFLQRDRSDFRQRHRYRINADASLPANHSNRSTTIPPPNDSPIATTPCN